MNTSPYTVADAILDTLKYHQVTHIFGYPGGAIMPFYDALPRHYPEIKHILTRHEQGAAFMAQGWARATKQLGVCCATSGPGATNLVTGIADAYMDSIPMLALTGQVFAPMIGKDAFQEVDIVGVTMTITKHNYLVDDPKNIVPVLSEAISIAMSGRPGPVLVDVPKDIMMADHEQKFSIPSPEIPDTDPMKHAFAELDASVIDQVVELLHESKQPVLLLGQGIKHAHAESLVHECIAKLDIPTVTTVLAKGVINHDCRQNLGMLGMHGFYHSNQAMHNADLIVNIGSRFDDRIVGRYDTFAHSAKVVHIDIDPSELGKAVQTDVPIHSDAKLFLGALLEHPDLRKMEIADWWQQIQDWTDQEPYERTTEAFSMRNCLADFHDRISADPKNFIVSVDVGQHQMWSALSCMVGDSCQWLCSGGSGTMGFGLPAAIGAAFAKPEQTVIAISGDGGIQMNIQELGVIADHDLNVKVVILNNNYLGMVRQWQELVYEKNYSEVAISSPDYKIIAEGYGLPGYIVTNAEEMKTVNKEVFAKPGPAVIEYRVAQEDNVFPMVPQGKHLGETIMKPQQSS